MKNAREMKNLIPSKTYKTKENVYKAVEKCPGFEDGRQLRFLIMTTEDGRFYPVFIGHDAIGLVHFGFCVAA